MYLEVKDVKKSYGSDAGYTQVLKGVTTSVEKGEMCVIQGTSGSGKSTLLNCIGGLDIMDSGSVKVDGTEIFGLKADALAKYRKANLGFIFQFYNLVPNLTVEENIQVCEYLTDKPLDMNELLDTLGLTEHRKKFPSQLSGGMQQRAAIARALAYEPTFIMMDEPFAALDYFTREQMQKELLRVQQERSASILFVTHSIDEALILGSQIAVIEKGMVKALYEVKAPQEERNLLEDEMITLKRDIINNLHFI